MRNLDDWLTMHRSITLVNFQLDAQNSVFTYIYITHLLTLRLLMSYVYMEHLFLMFLDHTQRRSTVGRTPLDE